MSASPGLVKIIRVRITREDSGILVARSPDLKGFLAVSRDLNVLEQELIPHHIRDLYLARGERVVVAPTEEHDTAPAGERPWVVVPAEVAQKALQTA